MSLALDQDVAAATDLQLNRINAQTYRNALASLAQHQSLLITNEQAFLALVGRNSELTLREQVMLALADKFMTKSTSTVVSTYVATSVLDGQKLKVAIDEAIKAAA